MEITFEIDDSTLEGPVKQAASSAINRVVKEVVDRKLSTYTNVIESAIDKYLEKNLTDDMIKNHIDRSTIEILKERLKDL